MRFAYLTHSLVSCWNHGNAHFQRGILRALIARGHTATAWEPEDSWSRRNLVQDQGDAPEALFHEVFPDLLSGRYGAGTDLAQVTDNTDVVIVHEWTDPVIVAQLGLLRAQGRFVLLFHDTHHRAVSDTQAIGRYDLQHYDGILAFGAALADIYRRWGWGNRAFVWHEAADTTVFRSPAEPEPRDGVVWIGNWGDGEREAELENFLLAPARDAELELAIHGVRYPQHARDLLRRYGARYHGWAANARAPEIFARHAMTVHVPRRFYAHALLGIPTIRVFEALACGIPLISAPWSDSEALFRPGEDFLVARDGSEMRDHMIAVRNDPALAATIARSGLTQIAARHSCDIRAGELLGILARITNSTREAA